MTTTSGGGEPTAHARQAMAAAARGQHHPRRVGIGVAIVAGDLAGGILGRDADDGRVPVERLARAADRFHRMRLELAAGACVDLADVDVDPALRSRLKGGAYTVEGALLIGAALASTESNVETALRAYGEPLGQALQILDDLADADAPAGAGRSRRPGARPAGARCARRRSVEPAGHRGTRTARRSGGDAVTEDVARSSGGCTGSWPRVGWRPFAPTLVTRRRSLVRLARGRRVERRRWATPPGRTRCATPGSAS